MLGQAPDTYRESFVLAAQVGISTTSSLRRSRPPPVCETCSHAYLDVDHDRVAEATGLAPDLFGEYVRQASRWLAERSGGA